MFFLSQLFHIKNIPEAFASGIFVMQKDKFVTLYPTADADPYFFKSQKSVFADTRNIGFDAIRKKFIKTFLRVLTKKQNCITVLVA